MDIVKLPKAFFDDRDMGEQPMPKVIRETSKYYLVDRADPAMTDYLHEARHYSRDVDAAPMGVVLSARHTVKAITGKMG